MEVACCLGQDSCNPRLIAGCDEDGVGICAYLGFGQLMGGVREPHTRHVPHHDCS